MVPVGVGSPAPGPHQLEAAVDQAADVTISRLPLVGRFINALVNGVLDFA